MISLIPWWALTVLVWYDFTLFRTPSILIELGQWGCDVIGHSLGACVWGLLGKNDPETLPTAWCWGLRWKGLAALRPTQWLGGWTLGARGGNWELKAHLIHQSVLAQIAWDGCCWLLLFPDKPCLFINELHHWFVVLATRLCLGPGWGGRGESSQLCCPAVTFTQGTGPDLFSVGFDTNSLEGVEKFSQLLGPN